MPAAGEGAPEEPVVYSVRLSIQADQGMTQVMLDIAQHADDPAQAREWKNRLTEHLKKLTTFPRGHATAKPETSRFKREIRRSLYKKHHVLFTVEDEGDDGPTVRVIHIRHASRRPPTPTEARQILTNQ